MEVDFAIEDVLIKEDAVVEFVRPPRISPDLRGSSRPASGNRGLHARCRQLGLGEWQILHFPLPKEAKGRSCRHHDAILAGMAEVLSRRILI